MEDHPVTREGFAQLLNREAGLTVCGGTASATTALSEVESLQPDLVIVDIALPGKDGLELVNELATFHPELPTLVFSTLDELIYAERALQAGAKGYAMKQAPMEQILAAVREVLSGEVYLSEAMRNHLLLRSLDASSDPDASGIEALSTREVEIFRLLGDGMGTRSIATSLGLSISTIESHRTHIKKKLGVNKASELTRLAVEWCYRQNFKA